MDNSFIDVGTFQHSHDAHLLKAKLETEGIEAFVHFDNSSVTGFVEAAGITGIKVRIRKQDFEKAKELLKPDGDQKEYEDHLKSDDIVIDGRLYIPWSGYCPNCDNYYTYMKKGTPLRTAIAIATIGLASFLFFGRTYACTNCGHKWKD